MMKLQTISKQNVSTRTCSQSLHLCRDPWSTRSPSSHAECRTCRNNSQEGNPGDHQQIMSQLKKKKKSQPRRLRCCSQRGEGRGREQVKSRNRRVLREECGTKSNGINGSNNGVGDGLRAAGPVIKLATAGPMKQPTMLCGSSGLGIEQRRSIGSKGRKPCGRG